MKNSTGFTLIEVIAAMAIIAIGLISLLALFPTGIATNQLAAATSEATILCKSMMQEIKKAATSMDGPGAAANPVTLANLKDDDTGKWYEFNKYEEPGANDEREVFPDNSLYEVSVDIEENFGPYNDDGIARVVVTGYWPLAGDDPASKDKQRSVKLVSFIRYNKP